jgi:hypothetical protein
VLETINKYLYETQKSSNEKKWIKRLY